MSIFDLSYDCKESDHFFVFFKFNCGSEERFFSASLGTTGFNGIQEEVCLISFAHRLCLEVRKDSRRVEITVRHPISVTFPCHYNVTARNSPHLPCLVIARGRQDLFPWVKSDPEEQNVQHYEAKVRIKI